MTAAEAEFSRTLRIDRIGAAPHRLSIEADGEERAALALRFGLLEIDSLAADLSLTRDGTVVEATGTLRAEVTQACVATGEPVEARIEEPFRIRFSPSPDPGRAAEEEIELSEEDCDTVFYDGAMVDIGEAVAETLSLSLDPWPRAPGAEEVLKEAGVKSAEEAKDESSPFAGLAALRDKLG